MKTTIWLTLLAVIIPFLLVGCGPEPGERPEGEMEGTSHGHGHGHGHGHHHEPPHGGIPVVLGPEEFHLEFVLVPEAGEIHAYVLDAHMENFVRIEQESFPMIARVGGETREIVFKAVANSATGESVGNTSMFKAQADWVKTNAVFEGTIPEIEIRGRTYRDVRAQAPQ